MCDKKSEEYWPNKEIHTIPELRAEHRGREGKSSFKKYVNPLTGETRQVDAVAIQILVGGLMVLIQEDRKVNGVWIQNNIGLIKGKVEIEHRSPQETIFTELCEELGLQELLPPAVILDIWMMIMNSAPVLWVERTMPLFECRIPDKYVDLFLDMPRRHLAMFGGKIPGKADGYKRSARRIFIVKALPSQESGGSYTLAPDPLIEHMMLHPTLEHLLKGLANRDFGIPDHRSTREGPKQHTCRLTGVGGTVSLGPRQDFVDADTLTMKTVVNETLFHEGGIGREMVEREEAVRSVAAQAAEEVVAAQTAEAIPKEPEPQVDVRPSIAAYVPPHRRRRYGETQAPPSTVSLKNRHGW